MSVEPAIRPSDVPETDILACDALVVGGGPAGIAAAVELAAAGLAVVLCEQGGQAGGALHRRPHGAAAAKGVARAVARQWRRLSAALAASTVALRTRHVFLGIDADGLALMEDRAAGRLVVARPSAVVLAVGAVEKVRPWPGWQLPGVGTAGSLQVMMKETGRAPAGRILVAGNGPLTLALAAQLARRGNAPVAVIESGDPLRGALKGIGLAAHPGRALEAAGYMARLLLSGVPWRRGAAVTAISRRDDALVATVTRADGRTEHIEADRIALHDGIRPNAFGLAATRLAGERPYVVHAGDCREALGNRAAEADGRLAARRVLAALRGDAAAVAAAEKSIARERRLQALLGELFAPVSSAASLAGLPDETVLCRCEGGTVGDLRALLGGPDAPSPRELRLNGRFAMGACQGRFCADWVSEATAALAPGRDPFPTEELTGRRWPLRPVAIASVVGPCAGASPDNDAQRGTS